MPGMHDPELAKRLAAIEREFRKLDRHRSRSSPLARPPRRKRRLRTAYVWAIIASGALAYAAIAHPWGTERVPTPNGPPLISTQDTVSSSLPSTGITPDRLHARKQAANPVAGSPARARATTDEGVILPTATKVGPCSASRAAAAPAVAHRSIPSTRADSPGRVDHHLQLLRSMSDPQELTRPGIRRTGPDSVPGPHLPAPGNTLLQTCR